MEAAIEDEVALQSGSATRRSRETDRHADQAGDNAEIRRHLPVGNRFRIDWESQALETSPAHSNAEELEAIHERNRLFHAALHHHGEETAETTHLPTGEMVL